MTVAQASTVMRGFPDAHTHDHHATELGMGDANGHVHHASSSHQHSGHAHMTMAFSQSSDVVLLFDWWHPTSPLSYLCSLVVVFAACLLSEWLRWNDTLTSTDRSEHRPLFGSDSSAAVSRKPVPSLARQGHLVGRHVGTIGLNFAIMLLVMTYNAGVFVTVVGGLAVGRVLFARDSAGGAQSARTGTVTPELCHE